MSHLTEYFLTVKGVHWHVQVPLGVVSNCGEIRRLHQDSSVLM